MQRMFQSATLKLTAWYLAILMVISITFSLVIYGLNTQELSSRLENLQHSLVDEWHFGAPNTYILKQPGSGPGTPLFYEAEQAKSKMALTLIYINLVLFISGGLGSYFLARRTLRPISEAHESQSRFTSDASHELRTPLSAMKAELEVSLRDPSLTLVESRELLESNLEEVNKLIQLSEMLLNLSRLDHNKLEVTRIDLVEVLNEALANYPAEKKRFDVTTRKKAVIQANGPAIQELFNLLIDNSLKYSPKKSKIFIRIFEQRGQVGFEISNYAKQIPEELLPKLFNRFFRADSSRTGGNKKGYGLGLSIAKKIVDIHHGNITVTSNPEKTTFLVTLFKSQFN